MKAPRGGTGRSPRYPQDLRSVVGRQDVAAPRRLPRRDARGERDVTAARRSSGTQANSRSSSPLDRVQPQDLASTPLLHRSPGSRSTRREERHPALASAALHSSRELNSLPAPAPVGIAGRPDEDEDPGDRIPDHGHLDAAVPRRGIAAHPRRRRLGATSGSQTRASSRFPAPTFRADSPPTTPVRSHDCCRAARSVVTARSRGAV